MPISGAGFEAATLLPELAASSFERPAENLGKAGTPFGVEHYVGRAGPDPGYVNLPPSTVGIGGPLIFPKKTKSARACDLLRLLEKAARR
jgi:hypothetical protein